ncbi:hypothetical protein BT63DRAFT_424539 [Microthyrium microscopicum]|uniref:Uncharacterized protein n=1 Tax=Microthyrium microscopicum TaxID=703497 RepID=A0A6A6UG40_9PEZI|nr:hypothetical protein BT63DRAFT_424539 [Microthyrium microscopicum]
MDSHQDISKHTSVTWIQNTVKEIEKDQQINPGISELTILFYDLEYALLAKRRICSRRGLNQQKLARNGHRRILRPVLYFEASVFWSHSLCS